MPSAQDEINRDAEMLSRVLIQGCTVTPDEVEQLAEDPEEKHVVTERLRLELIRQRVSYVRTVRTKGLQYLTAGSCPNASEAAPDENLQVSTSSCD